MDSPSYKLATAHVKGGMESGTIRPISDMSIQDYETYRNHVSTLAHIERADELFGAVKANYSDFRRSLDHWRDQCDQYESPGVTSMAEVKLSVNRTSFNFVSLARTFVDHSAFAISKFCGADSVELARFVAATNRAFEENFAYRLLNKLRNFVQHCGFPVVSLASGNRLDRGKMVRYREVVYPRDELLAQYDSWGALLRKELAQGPESIDVPELLTAFLRAIEALHVLVVEIVMERTAGSREYIAQLLAQCEGFEGCPCVVDMSAFESWGSERGFSLQISWIPTRIP